MSSLIIHRENYHLTRLRRFDYHTKLCNILFRQILDKALESIIDG